jgi:hypothetical protein
MQPTGPPAVERPLPGLVLDQLEALGDPLAAAIVVGV